MKLNNKGEVATIIVFLLMVAGCTAWLRGNEYLDKEIINKERWKTQERIVMGDKGSPGYVHEWRDKHADMIKIAPGSDLPGVIYPDDLETQTLK